MVTARPSCREGLDFMSRKRNDKPRFVILEHRWDGIHWDFMLEDQGVLRTWAILAPIQVGIDLKAKRLPDHRIAYLDFEGEISGDRGSVVRVDRGSFEALEWLDEWIEVKLRGVRYLGTVKLRRIVDQSGGDPADSDWFIRFVDG